MMPTTVRLPPDLILAARDHARETGRSFDDLIVDALRHELGSASRTTAALRPLPTYPGTGMLAEADLNDTTGLLDLMDRI